MRSTKATACTCTGQLKRRQRPRKGRAFATETEQVFFLLAIEPYRTYIGRSPYSYWPVRELVGECHQSSYSTTITTHILTDCCSTHETAPDTGIDLVLHRHRLPDFNVVGTKSQGLQTLLILNHTKPY